MSTFEQGAQPADDVRQALHAAVNANGIGEYLAVQPYQDAAEVVNLAYIREQIHARRTIFGRVTTYLSRLLR